MFILTLLYQTTTTVYFAVVNTVSKMWRERGNVDVTHWWTCQTKHDPLKMKKIVYFFFHGILLFNPFALDNPHLFQPNYSQNYIGSPRVLGDKVFPSLISKSSTPAFSLNYKYIMHV